MSVDIMNLMPAIEHTAGLVKGDMWDSLLEEEKHAHLEQLAPMAYASGVTPEMVDSFLSGDYDKIQSENESLSAQIGGEAERDLEGAISDMLSFFRSDSAFFAKAGGKLMCVNRIGHNTIIARIVDSKTPAVPRVEITYDPDGIVYSKTVQHRVKAVVDTHSIYWEGESDDLTDEDTDFSEAGVINDDSLEDSL